jgi:hypothetical protein
VEKKGNGLVNVQMEFIGGEYKTVVDEILNCLRKTYDVFSAIALLAIAGTCLPPSICLKKTTLHYTYDLSAILLHAPVHRNHV